MFKYYVVQGSLWVKQGNQLFIVKICCIFQWAWHDNFLQWLPQCSRLNPWTSISWVVLLKSLWEKEYGNEREEKLHNNHENMKKAVSNKFYYKKNEYINNVDENESDENNKNHIAKIIIWIYIGYLEFDNSLISDHKYQLVYFL